MMRLSNLYNNLANVYLYFSSTFTFSSIFIILMPHIPCFISALMLSLLLFNILHSCNQIIQIISIPCIISVSMLILNCLFSQYIDISFFYLLSLLLSMSFMLLYVVTKILGKRYTNVISFLITGILMIYIAPVVIFITGISFDLAAISIITSISLVALFVNIIYNCVMSNKKLSSIRIFLLLFGNKT